jgi:carboxyl-terminal processing protease
VKDEKNARPLRAARILLVTGALCCLTMSAALPASAQSLGSYDRDSARTMLSTLKDDLKKNYYDPSLRGMDLEARFRDADEKIKQAQTRDQLIVAVAQVMLDLNDSHTFFLPPSRAAHIEYGWQMQMVGDDCYVSAVKPKSDAEAKGLKPGDRILSVDGYRPARANIWKMYYRYYALMPSRSVRLSVQSPGDAAPRELDVATKIEMGQAVAQWVNLLARYISEEWDIDHDRFYESGDELMVWKMPTFEVSPGHVDDIMARARKFKTLVIDLRDNGGGYEETMARLAGYFFDHDVKVADLKGRKEMKPVLAKTRGDAGYKGRLIVLVDSNSGSASELFARVVQLEKRGTVLGDRTAGAVMTAKHFDHQTGVGSVLYFGASVTVADMIMSDGKSLENVGVMPDEVVLPEGTDLTALRDPVLARAASLAGVQLTPEKAGTLFPVEWRK